MIKNIITFSSLFISFSQVFAYQKMVVEMDDRVPLSHLNLVLYGGYAQENSEQIGITDFTAEMMLRGTRFHSKKEFDESLEELGASLSVETKADAVIFRASVLTEEVEKFHKLWEEMLLSPSFPQTEVQKLQQDKISRMIQSKSQDAYLAKLFFDAFLFKNHPFGFVETEKGIKKINKETVASFYKTRFHQKRLALFASGKWSQTQLQLFQKTLEKLPVDGIPSHPLAPPTPWNQKKIIVVDKPKRTQTQILMGQTGISILDPRYTALQLGLEIFGGSSFDTILMQEVRVKRGWSYGAGTTLRSASVPFSLSTRVFPAMKDAPQTIALIQNLLKDLKTNGVEREQFEKIKKSEILKTYFLEDSAQKRMENRMIEHILKLPSGFLAQEKERLEATSWKSTQDTIKNFIHDQNVLLVVVGTAKDLVPELSKTLQIDAKDIEVYPYDFSFSSNGVR